MVNLKRKNIKKIIILLINLVLAICKTEVDLTSYTFPKQDNESDIIKVALMGTNDIHGEIFPSIYQAPNNTHISNGGATNIYSYSKILREDWGDYFLWLDGGDQFQGSVECMLSEGSVMRDYYNFVNVDAIAIGNHEFDYGQERLKEHIKNQKFPTLCANLYDKIEKKYIWEEGMWENVKPYHVFKLGNSTEIKIGVIGLATRETISMSAEDLSNLEFQDYVKITKKYVDILRNEEKVDAVILLTHFGPKCSLEPIEKMELKMRTKQTHQEVCDEDVEIMDFLKELKNQNIKVDGLVGAHIHDIVHHWINDIPCIESSGASYFHVMYLPFKKNEDGTVSLINDDISIEGPVPVCEKIWADTKKCNYKEKESTLMTDFIFHDKEPELDLDLMDALKNWYDIINEKTKNILAQCNTEMSVNGVQETVLTNFINDLGRVTTDSDISFYNTGGIRHSWHNGGINEIDIFKMFPFNNTWVRFEMTGEEVVRLFSDLNLNMIYPSRGVVHTYLYKDLKYYLREIELFDGKERKKIDPKKTYKICTNDFLANGGTGMGKVRKWYTELRNLKKFGIIRDSVIKYLRLMKVINEEFFIDPKNPILYIFE